ncbi:MAG: hypothetical protein NPIRA05_20090 [Nitrospirales bacterium]|nr:MAG: hypothetical protein NPIRA05_20090 [Nitrospirales bacterium]
MSASSQSSQATTTYRWIIFGIVVGLVFLGALLLQFTDSSIQALKSVSQEFSQETFDTSTFLFVFIAMAAGFPAVGIGTYLLYQGNQIRVTPPLLPPECRMVVDTSVMKRFRDRVRGQALMVCGSLVILSGLGLPILAWWLAENL